MNKNPDFYILEFATNPGLYYCDSQFGVTDDVLLAERYSSPQEALRFKANPKKWRVVKVHLQLERI